MRKDARAISTASAAVVLLVLVVGAGSIAYVNSTQGTQDQIAKLQSQIAQVAAQQKNFNASALNLSSLPVMNQAPTIRTVTETWFLSPSAHQDRFDPSFIVVNQGDTVHLTFIDNDTVAHDFVIGPPYNIIVNATVPGLINDLTGQVFTEPAKNNSPGVVVKGTPGNVSADYSFMAKYSGIFEFVCTYHAQVGMIGYLVVLPNLAYKETTSTGGHPANESQAAVVVSLVDGASTDTKGPGYSPDSMTVVIGVNNTVEWVNNDSSPHTVTADGGSFNSGNMAPSQTFTYTFLTPGVYKYHCTYHPWMTGEVIVKG